MRDNKFDLKIKEALKDQRIDVEATDWNVMNEKLNEAFGFQDDPQLEREFDNSISNKVNADQSEYNHAHWDLLVERLEKEEEKYFHASIRKVLRYVAILLLFLSIWNWQGASFFENNSKLNESPRAGLIEHENLESTKAASEENKIDIARVETNPVVKPNTSNATVVFVPGGIVKQTAALQYAAKLDLAPNVIHTTTRLDQSKLFLASTSNKAGSIVYEKKIAIDELSSLDPLSIDNLSSKRAFNKKMPTLDFKNESNDFVLSLGMVSSPDLYLIRSPEDAIYPLPSYYTGSRGLSGGIVFSAEKNNVELLTGINYSSVSYQPRDYVERFSSDGAFYETSLNNIFFNSISVPVNFNIYFDLGTQSRIYTTLGTTFNAIINSNFDIAETKIPEPAGLTGNNQRRKPLLDSKDFEEGIFEGGSIFDNTFFTGDIGFGYLRSFKNNWSFYVQPTLHTQYTEGIGPNLDYLHKLSIYAGVKYTL